MPWYRCTVNEVGPVSDSSETPDLVVYINLTDTRGAFADTWFYAANGIQNQLLDVGIAAINGRKDIEVAATAPHPGNQPYTDISRIYGLRPQPPEAPSEFHKISLSPEAVLVVGWKDNSYNEESFHVKYRSPNSVDESVVEANSVTASLQLIPEYTYNVYVAAVNSAGETPSNAITVTVPPAQPAAASLLAAVQEIPFISDGYQLFIEGQNFGANEMVEATVDWMVDNQTVTFPLDQVTANWAGYFQHYFTGNTPYGFCPQSGRPDGSQPLQRFHVRARGLVSNKTANADAGPFTCPF